MARRTRRRRCKHCRLFFHPDPRNARKQQFCSNPECRKGSKAASQQRYGYTPEERSQNASKQLRDANGRFVVAGGTVHVKSNRRTAKIKTVNQENGTVTIEYSDGTTQVRPVTDVVNINPDKAEGGTEGRTTKSNPDDYASDPRATKTTPKAWLDKLLPPMDEAELKKVFDDYAAYIEEMRKRGKVDYSKFAALTPENSDVKPLYLAQVDELDNKAVVGLISSCASARASRAGSRPRGRRLSSRT